MLRIKIPSIEGYDEINNLFINIPETNLQLEHSLVSIAKWEAKWKKPFLSRDNKSEEEILDYIKCMVFTQNVNPQVFNFIPTTELKKINEYIEDPMTATTFRDDNASASREILTAEVIYYYMIALNIPFECQKWHLNRLLTLIKVCSIKNAPEKKMSLNETIARNKALNAARRKQFNSRG